jgi:hypothetical protein
MHLGSGDDNAGTDSVLTGRPWWLPALYVCAALLASVLLDPLSGLHVWKMYRASLPHLLAGQDLYANYSSIYHDVYKYSPTFPLLFSPFALLPDRIALPAWNFLNAGVLYLALSRALSGREGKVALILGVLAFLISTDGCQVNPLVAGLMVLTFVGLERDRQVPGAIALAGGAAIKVFPLAAVPFAFFHGRPWRFLLLLGVMGVATVLLPLLVTSPAQLVEQYSSWFRIESQDALPGYYYSMNYQLSQVLGVVLPAWPLGAAGTIALLAPLVRNPALRTDPRFRLLFLCSVLGYVVVFNHQAERETQVIALTGLAIWAAIMPRHWARSALIAGGFTTLSIWLTLAAWIGIQVDLWRRGTATPTPRS